MVEVECAYRNVLVQVLNWKFWCSFSAYIVYCHLTTKIFDNTYLVLTILNKITFIKHVIILNAASIHFDKQFLDAHSTQPMYRRFSWFYTSRRHTNLEHLWWWKPWVCSAIVYFHCTLNCLPRSENSMHCGQWDIELPFCMSYQLPIL